MRKGPQSKILYLYSFITKSVVMLPSYISIHVFVIFFSFFFFAYIKKSTELSARQILYHGNTSVKILCRLSCLVHIIQMAKFVCTHIILTKMFCSTDRKQFIQYVMNDTKQTLANLRLIVLVLLKCYIEDKGIYFI